MLKVNEIFFSVQGESSLVGLPCVFVRLTKCDLRCSYCDTKYAYYEGVDMTLEEVIKKVENYNCQLVLITGGEPLLQQEAYPLMEQLCDKGYRVMLETSGHILVDKVDKRVKKIIDMKTPSSLMSKRNNFQNLDIASTDDEIKFVIGTREDYEWSRQIVLERNLTDKTVVLFSSVFEVLSPLQLVSWILEDGLKVRFQLQLHKFIWEPNTRGV